MPTARQTWIVLLGNGGQLEVTAQQCDSTEKLVRFSDGVADPMLARVPWSRVICVYRKCEAVKYSPPSNGGSKNGSEE